MAPDGLLRSAQVAAEAASVFGAATESESENPDAASGTDARH